jgi:hypothetical protein
VDEDVGITCRKHEKEMKVRVIRNWRELKMGG